MPLLRVMPKHSCPELVERGGKGWLSHVLCLIIQLCHSLHAGPLPVPLLSLSSRESDLLCGKGPLLCLTCSLWPLEITLINLQHIHQGGLQHHTYCEKEGGIPAQAHAQPSISPDSWIISSGSIRERLHSKGVVIIILKHFLSWHSRCVTVLTSHFPKNSLSLLSTLQTKCGLFLNGCL